MNQLRFQVRPGPAARLSEQHEGALPQPLRGVRAGSAARDAEERKRGEGLSAGTSGFSLRAQGGSIVRRDAIAGCRKAPDPVETDPQAAAAGKNTAAAAETARPNASMDEPPPSATSVTLLHRLRTLFE